MVSGAMNDEAGIKCPVFSPPTGPVHRRQISDFDVICTGDICHLANELPTTYVPSFLILTFYGNVFEIKACLESEHRQ